MTAEVYQLPAQPLTKKRFLPHAKNLRRKGNRSPVELCINGWVAEA